MTHLQYLQDIGLAAMNQELNAAANELLDIIDGLNTYNRRLAHILGSQIVIMLEDQMLNHQEDLENRFFHLCELDTPAVHALTNHNIIGSIVYNKELFCAASKHILEQNGGVYTNSIIQDYARKDFAFERYKQCWDAQRDALENVQRS